MDELFVFNFDQSDASCYYKLCSNITPDSARSLPHLLNHDEEGEGETVEGDQVELEPIPILQPPPGFGDSSSDEEFFDARDRFTSPEDPTSGAVPRAIGTGMNDGKPEENRKGDEEGGGRETLYQLRKRSCKRRSFMESDYTSRVSYPEPDPQSQHDPVSNRLHKNLLAGVSDTQMLSSDPEPSKQTRNPSSTVSCLTHSEGEPALLESKPILSKPLPHKPDSPSRFGYHGQARDPQAFSRTRKQEMEMEPDAMESKSVTDHLKTVSPTITVVRCRVDPDGKESADRRVTEVEGKGEDAGEEGKGGVTEYSSSSKRPLIGAERQPEANPPPECLTDGKKKTAKTPEAQLKCLYLILKRCHLVNKITPTKHNCT
ncbi:FERM and PDZ domain-containing protein 1-like [Scomber japonicus]|uniref:FERM and PDZ domain-containing protein 1-like n=1 Tax=Scomber japonicus TaxID=13676 RepID=UPI002306CC6F|nr:FERM and PDZ domain-containing protein 1-like [Scomber japonicus]